MDHHLLPSGATLPSQPNPLPNPFSHEQDHEPAQNTQHDTLPYRQSVAYPPLMAVSVDSLASDKTARACDNAKSTCQEPVEYQDYSAVGFVRTSDFIRLYSVSGDLPLGDDTLTFPGVCDNIISITGLHAALIESRSPLIAAAFECSRSGRRLHLETLSEQTAAPFVRFLYTGSYAESGDWEDVPTSLLLHCNMAHLGDIYDMPDLKSQAYVNILRQCEFGCSSPDKPIDLCSAISFTYENLTSQGQIADAIVHYCVSCFLSHNLSEDAQFKELAYHLRAFHQDLTTACKNRDYADESAAAIIQMPYKHYAPETYASTENPAIARFQDLIHHFHSSDRFDEEASPKKRQRITFDETPDSPAKVLRKAETSNQTEITLPLRPFPAPTFNIKNEETPASRLMSLPVRPFNSNDSQTQQLPIWKRRPMKDFHDATIDGRFTQFAEDLKVAFPHSRRRVQLHTELQPELQANLPWERAARGLVIRSPPEDHLPSEPSDNASASAWDWEDWGPDPVQATVAADAIDSTTSPEQSTATSAAAAAAAAAAAESTAREMPNTNLEIQATANEDDSDSDAFTWVDIPLDSSKSNSQVVEAAASSRPNHARSVSGDSDWDFCLG